MGRRDFPVSRMSARGRNRSENSHSRTERRTRWSTSVVYTIRKKIEDPPDRLRSRMSASPDGIASLQVGSPVENCYSTEIAR